MITKTLYGCQFCNTDYADKERAMEVNVNTKAICTIDIDSAEAFRILCETLHIGFVLDEDTDYFVYKNSDDELNVFKTVDGHDSCVDERGDLFVALRNVAVNIFPNTSFRSADYTRKLRFIRI